MHQAGKRNRLDEVALTIASSGTTIDLHLSRSLNSARQVSFEWMLDTDALHLSGNLTESFRGVLIEQTSNWYSRDLLDLLHVDDRAHFVSEITACLKDLGAASMIAHNVVVRMRDPVCGWRWVEIHGQVVERDIGRRAVRMVGTISDINERRYAEQKLSRLTDLYAALSQTSQAIVRMADPELLFREICRIAVEHGHFHLAWIGLVNPSTGLVKPAAAFGNGQQGVYEAVVSVDASRPEGRGGIGTALRNNHYTVCHDIFAMPAMRPWYAAARRDGFRSFASFPFRRDGTAIGTLNLYASETGFSTRP